MLQKILQDKVRITVVKSKKQQNIVCRDSIITDWFYPTFNALTVSKLCDT